MAWILTHRSLPALYKIFQEPVKHINPEDGNFRIYRNLGNLSAFNSAYPWKHKSCNKEQFCLLYHLSHTSSTSFFSSVSFIFFFTFLQVCLYASIPFPSRTVVFWCSNWHNCASRVWKRCYTVILTWAHFPIFAVRIHFLRYKTRPSNYYDIFNKQRNWKFPSLMRLTSRHSGWEANWASK